LVQPKDGQKIYFGTDSDYSLYYDSTNDEYVIYDEVNGSKLMRLPKNRTLNNVLEAGGVHELLHSNMNIGTDDHHAQDQSANYKAGGSFEIDASEFAGAAGSAGQFLKTDGAACSWASAPTAKQKAVGGKVTKVGETVIDSSDVDKGVMLIRCY